MAGRAGTPDANARELGRGEKDTSRDRKASEQDQGDESRRRRSEQGSWGSRAAGNGERYREVEVGCLLSCK